jgi:hypothetical protein
VHAVGGNALVLLEDELELTLVLLDVILLEEADEESVLALALVAVVAVDALLLVSVETVLVELPPAPLSPPSGVKSLKPRISAQPIAATEDAAKVHNARRANRAIKKPPDEGKSMPWACGASPIAVTPARSAIPLQSYRSVRTPPASTPREASRLTDRSKAHGPDRCADLHDHAARYS